MELVYIPPMGIFAVGLNATANGNGNLFLVYNGSFFLAFREFFYSWLKKLLLLPSSSFYIYTLNLKLET